jgi:hypothetical protein
MGGSPLPSVRKFTSPSFLSARFRMLCIWDCRAFNRASIGDIASPNPRKVSSGKAPELMAIR